MVSKAVRNLQCFKNGNYSVDTKLRKEKIERVFADAKEKHARRYTPYKGIAQVSNWVRLKFATMNLKKLAKWKWKGNNTLPKSLILIVNFIEMKKNPLFA